MDRIANVMTPPPPPPTGIAPDPAPDPDPDPDSINATHARTDDTRPPPPPLRPPPAHASASLVDGRSFTVRGVLVGLLVGVVICFSNMHFGLQTGWVSIMSMPASLLGFGFFKTLSRHLQVPFSPVENVLVQSVAGGMSIMPLGCGFVGVIPAMQYLLTPAEGGPLTLGLGKLVVWSLGLCYFGVMFAVPLRRQVLIREQLKFPSGFSTAVLISVLHGRATAALATAARQEQDVPASFASLAAPATCSSHASTASHVDDDDHDDDVSGQNRPQQRGWRESLQILGLAFLVSGLLTFTTYFIPALRDVPIFGPVAAASWLWTLNPSLAYVGQGVIMGPSTTLHMLLGTVLGWGLLSPLAKYQGWAPGPVDDWQTGSKGWIVWVSLAIMLADAVVSLGHMATRQVSMWLPVHEYAWLRNMLRFSKGLDTRRYGDYAAVYASDEAHQDAGPASSASDTLPLTASRQGNSPLGAHVVGHEKADDAPPEDRVSDAVVVAGLVLSVAFCVLCIHFVVGDLVPLYANLFAVFIALVLSIMGVRALGETDLNPVSGISKLAQLFFALIIPQSNKLSVLINLVAGAVSEAGALQAGDLMQDLKTGHLLGAAPKAQFWGQIIGATVGAIISAFIYQLYTAIYTIPGPLFQAPTAYVWILTARLVTGQGLPPMAKQWATAFGVLFTVLTVLRIYYARESWRNLIPGGIAVAVGMYNVPSFTLARTIGGVFAWWWRRKGRDDSTIVVLASGLVLGEGVMSIASLLMHGFRIPHL